ncbi:hypothetical protein JW890_08255 [candidate division WOR-3 bacterium]|nr:hypothetical protein [candidate division WOR-3 bacterium]
MTKKNKNSFDENKTQKYQCTQCGSTDFIKEEFNRLRCSHCKTLYKINFDNRKAGKPSVEIKKGANVTFGKNAKVLIKGGMLIEDGAKVEFLGELELIEKGDRTAIGCIETGEDKP